MKLLRTSLLLGIAASALHVGETFFRCRVLGEPGLKESTLVKIDHISSLPSETSKGRNTLRATADPSTPSRKKGKRKMSVRQAMTAWATSSLELHEFDYKRIYVCKAKTLPEILSEFWSLAAECAQAKYRAMAADREYGAHVLFVVAECDLLKDYGMMRHLDKVLDFCSGGCIDFGRRVTLQHYHPKFNLPPACSSSEADNPALVANPTDLARVVNFSRSPFPAFGLTVASGGTRSNPLAPADKIGRLRLDLEMLLHMPSACSSDDCVDAHGAEHGAISASPETVRRKTEAWLASCAQMANEDDEGYVRHLQAVGDCVTSETSTPEEVFSDAWAIVSELQAQVDDMSIEVKSSGEPRGCKATMEGDTVGREPLASTLLVIPGLHAFNSALHENLGANLAIALKQTPIMERIEIEVFHPEFVKDDGVIDAGRRSPFPALLIMHCGTKDELFEPSGAYRHEVPPLKLPKDTPEEPNVSSADAGCDEDAETSAELSVDDAPR